VDLRGRRREHGRLAGIVDEMDGGHWQEL